MKTVQDWGFISKEQGLVKPKLQDNKIFHALTTAYENNQQQEIYGATENIVRREKELCELTLGDLKRLSGKGDADGTLKLVMEHYQQRLGVATEKEEKINQLSEDSRKMMEEYKKRTQELADVKRNLMDSQSKLRELAKTTERLLKKEEELRFIETNLRSELDKNKRNLINGLYEIVAEISEGPEPPLAGLVAAPPAEPSRAADTRTQPAAAGGAHASPPADVPSPASKAPEKPAVSSPEPSAEQSRLASLAEPPRERPFTEGLFRKPSSPLAADPLFGNPLGMPAESVWTRDQGQNAAPLFATAPASIAPVASPAPASRAPSAPVTSANAAIGPSGASLVEKAARLKMFEPGKSLCSKSMVKTAEGEVISEYFYSPLHPKESRQYIFNSLYAVWSLLSLKARDGEAFQERLETVFTDLLSRLEHGQNIHLEGFLNEEINKDTLAGLLESPRNERAQAFENLAARLLSRIESVGPGRAGLIDHQFKHLPKSEFPPRNGLTA
jgi:hypothetical protein